MQMRIWTRAGTATREALLEGASDCRREPISLRGPACRNGSTTQCLAWHVIQVEVACYRKYCGRADLQSRPKWPVNYRAMCGKRHFRVMQITSCRRVSTFCQLKMLSL